MALAVAFMETQPSLEAKGFSASYLAAGADGLPVKISLLRRRGQDNLFSVSIGLSQGGQF